MIYEEFSAEYTTALEKKQSKHNVQCVRQKLTKYNGLVKDSLAINFPHTNVSPVLYLDDEYALYQKGYSVEDLTTAMAKTIESRIKDFPMIPDLTAENAKNNLCCALINAETNKDLLKTAPHEIIEDLAVITRFRVGDGSFLVTDQICSHLKMTAMEVIEAARNNISKADYVLKPMTEMLFDSLKSQGIEDDYITDLLQTGNVEPSMYVLTTKHPDNGAAAILSKQAMSEAREKIGEDFFIIPSSRHEVILVPHSTIDDVDVLREMVKEVNSSAVEKVDQLSDNVYCYDGKRIRIADKLPTRGNDRSDTKKHSHSDQRTGRRKS